VSVRPSVRYSVCFIIDSNVAAVCGGFAAERRTDGIDRQRAPSSNGATSANAGNAMLTAELTRLNSDLG